ncbi:MAG: glycosyltransferase, partial [Actinomycetota bacterium]|nr:glycosyltransferase [Actinomycetota bacterium]
MKVLLVNNQYRPVPGGAEAVLLRTEELLRGEGHETIPFSLRHPDTLASPWTGDFPQADRLARSPWRRTDSLATLYSLSVRRRLERLIDRARPHVAHLHNVYEKLTLSVVDALRSRGVPIVLTLHDYRAVCPNGYLLAPDGPCIRCVRDRSTRHAVVHRCLGPSLGANLMAAAECAINRRLRQYDKVDLF